MARGKNTTARSKRFNIANINWQESYAGLILGAIIVVVLGLLVSNYFTKRSTDLAQNEQVGQIQGEGQKTTQMREYKVAADDSLSLISQKYYDTLDYWPALAQVNNIQNPNLIYKDTVLVIPDKSEVEEVRHLMTTTTYEVQAGDTLFLISEKVYGDGSKWTILDSANKVGRLANGNPLIFAGSVLTIPR